MGARTGGGTLEFKVVNAGREATCSRSLAEVLRLIEPGTLMLIGRRISDQ